MFTELLEKRRSTSSGAVFVLFFGRRDSSIVKFLEEMLHKKPYFLMHHVHPSHAHASFLAANERPPCLGVFVGSSRVGFLSDRDLMSSSPSAIRSAVEELVRKHADDDGRARSDEDDSENDDEEDAWCDKLGCNRTYPHTHVKSTAMTEYF